jgi:site-specific DNA-methyltransferase (adenine-specific)
MITPFYTTEKGQLYHGDNLEIMLAFHNDEFDLILTDPPYGLREAAGKNKNRGSTGILATDYGNKTWDNAKPLGAAFKEMKRISKNQIIFGGNYFIEHLSSGPCWLVWDKDNGKTDFADAELAWTSFKSAIRIFKYRWNGMLKEAPEKRYHPTQKPVGLFMRILERYAKAGQTICDPYTGSGTTALACERMGFRWVCIESDPDYCGNIVHRLQLELQQLKLFS